MNMGDKAVASATGVQYTHLGAGAIFGLGTAAAAPADLLAASRGDCDKSMTLLLGLVVRIGRESRPQGLDGGLKRVVSRDGCRLRKRFDAGLAALINFSAYLLLK